MRRVIALGFFDGVHIGHSALLVKTATTARIRGYLPCVLTFDRHPEEYISGMPIPLLETSAQRIERINREFGISDVVLAHFDNDMMHMPWQKFVMDVLNRQLNAGHVVAGHDFNFGYKGEGSPPLLKKLCEELCMGCDIVGRVELDGITVSSTYIRKLVKDGDMERAALFLGHKHSVGGEVQHGRGLGRTLGFPTVNLDMPDGVQCPAYGVYVTRTIAREKEMPSVTNVGVQPTVSDDGRVTIESTLLDFEGDLYGQNIRIEFLKKLRSEIKFNSPEQLKEQVEKDIVQAREYHTVSR